jgi:hypothetical protein
MTLPISEGSLSPDAPLQRAIRHALGGEWETAHSLAQSVQGADAAWVHAWLHRIEGDQANAAYWYRRAGKAAATGSTTTEGEAILRAISGG